MPLFAIGGVTSAGERDTKKSAERKRPVTTRGISELEVPHALAAAGLGAEPSSNYCTPSLTKPSGNST
jgi:hypothetical protein